MQRLKLSLGFLLAFATLAVQLHAQQNRNEMVSMRDGVRLDTNIYLPGGEGPWPVVLTRTPYGKDQMYTAKNEAAYMQAGYARVVQDVRGRFKSEGKYRPFADDLEDGYDTIEWVAKQPWANGKIGMVGPSAMGIATNLAAMSGAPHLTAAFVSVAHGSNFRYSRHPGGLYLKNLAEEWSKRQGVPPPDVPRPILAVYNDDARRMDMRNHLSQIHVPMYNLGGWYDIFLQGDIDSFTSLQKDGAPGARGNQKLAMGAFGHGPLSGDLKYPAEAGNLMGNADTMRWFDYWLKGIDTGVMKEPPVKYFVMGDTMAANAPGNAWRTAAGWPPKSTATSYFLEPGGKLATAKPASVARMTYVYDPKDPVPSIGGNNLMMDRGPMDQRKVSSRKDVLKFETEPLKAPVEIVGPVTAELAVSTDAADTDFMVKLVDVYPNGYEALVLDEGLRLRYRDGFVPEHAQPGKVYPIKVDLWSTALIFNTGHKIAVHVSSSNSPRFEPHSNTWDPVKSYDEAVKATNTVVLDGRSKIILPVTKVYPGEKSVASR
ncbi:MAG: CocE/NonD family hydrolase [Acidobacteriia bacterium]|nr:CocE/NonD family hydrolase [Terriglobia bacterium]